MNKNPYHSPTPSVEEDDLDDGSPQKIVLTREGRLNLGFAATICRGLAVFCFVAAVFLTYRLYMNMRGQSGADQLSHPIYILELVRGLPIPVLVLLGWFLWNFNRSLTLASMLKFMPGSAQMEVHIQRLTWVLIGLGLFALVNVIEAVFRASLLYFMFGVAP